MRLILVFASLLLTSGYEIAFIGVDLQIFEIVKSSLQSISTAVIVRNFSTTDEIPFECIQDLSLVIDATTNQISHSKVINFTTMFHIPTIIIGHGNNKNEVFFTEFDNECQISAIDSVLSYFSMKKLGVIWSYNAYNKKIVESLEKTTWNILFTSVGSLVSVDEMTKLLGKTFKAKGIQNYLFLGDKNSCKTYEQSFHNSYLENEGVIAVFLNECIYQTANNGSLILTNLNTIRSNSYSDYVSSTLFPYFSVFRAKSLSNYQIFSFFRSLPRVCNYSLINIQKSEKVVIGKVINGQVNISEPIIYYGGKNESYQYERPLITISANTGVENPPGYANVYQNAKYQEGTYFGVAKINRDRSVLPYHELVLNDKVNCGVSVFTSSYSKTCFLSNIQNMGIAYIPTTYPVTPSVLTQLYSLNISIPFIGGTGSSGSLSNSTAYPNFVRMVSPSNVVALAWAKLINIFGWEKIVVFYTNDAYGLPIYSVLYNEAEKYGYQIVNDVEYRGLPPITSNASLGNYTKSLQNALNTGCNLFFLAMSDPSPFFLLEELYNLGVRRGDLAYFFFYSTGLDSINITGGNSTKRSELMHGSFLIYNAGYYSQYGSDIKTEFLSYYNETWMRSFFIDAVFVISNTISFLLHQGLQYENQTLFMASVRNTRMQGASGVISFDEQSNNRNLYYFNLYNFYQDNLTHNWNADAIAIIAPLSNVYYTVLQNPVWPTGTMPLDMQINYLNCPFREKQISESDYGKSIKIGFCVGLLVLALALTVYALKRISYSRVIVLQAKAYATFDDYLVFGFIFIENVQILSLGPDFASFNRLVSYLSQLLSLNLVNVISFKDETFWVIFYGILIVTYAWLLILLISALRVPLFGWLRSKIEVIKVISIPIMPNYMFLPITVVLLCILCCDKSIGPELHQSYLNYDCREFCWIDSHLYKVVPASFLIISYIPLAVLYRTLWQEQNTQVNIRTDSLYLVLKNIAYVALVILGKTLKNDYSLAHAIVYGVIILAIFVVLNLKTPYNYDRATLWSKVLIVCVFWNCLICIFSILFNSDNLIWLLVQIVGWIGIFIVGVILQSKLPPSLIITKKGRNIYNLFRFIFGYEDYKYSLHFDFDSGRGDDN